MTEQSTFNILPQELYQITVNRNPSDAVAGQFQVTTGNPVSFYIFTSAQFSAFQNGSPLDSVYNVTNSASSSFSYTFSAQDTFYLIFRHGYGLLNTTQTVHFTRTYTATNSLSQVLGYIFVAFGALNLGLATRGTKPKAVDPATQTPSS